MRINISKWYNNASSPVMFMIDDLANTWVDANDNGKLDLGEDWGWAKYEENSSVSFLEKSILSLDDRIKVTFFVPVGKRVGMIKNSTIKTVSNPINHDEESREFFRSLNKNNKYELAYHGTTHGVVGVTSTEFKQEWETYTTEEEAIRTVKEGIKVYKDTIGVEPFGGKYCGYTSNKFSDKSIDVNNFLWWCRFCNLQTSIVAKNNSLDKYVYGEDINDITNFDIKYFGVNKVIDIPTTVNGGMLSSLYNNRLTSIKGLIKTILRPYLKRKRLKYVDYLLKNQLVISIQEHISPTRDDGKIQTPNIFTDKESLREIFNHLKYKNIWYCTGTELASYVYYRDSIKFEVYDNEFKLNYDELKEFKFKDITINIFEGNEIITPSGQSISIKNNFVNVPIESGIYKVI